MLSLLVWVTVTRIANELGRGGQTVRAHLTRKTETGKLVRETHKTLLKGEKVLKFIVKEAEASPSKEEVERLKAKIKRRNGKKLNLQEKLNKMQGKIENVAKALKEALNQLKVLTANWWTGRDSYQNGFKSFLS